MHEERTATNESSSSSNNTSELRPYLSPLAAWALAIGWGSLVVTSSAYLSSAGPLGSVIGLLIGFAIMAEISEYMDGTGKSENLAMPKEEFLAMQLRRLHEADQ